MSERPPEAVLWDFLRGAMMTQALRVVAALGIADAVTSEPMHVDDLARATGADAATLHRVLRALASEGVFEEREPRVYAATAVSEALRRDGWAEFAHLFGGVFYDAVADLERGVRTGTPTFHERFGDDFWSWLAAHPDEREAFDGAMAGGKEGTAARLAELPWRAGEVVVDVGGGNGALLLALLRLRPELRGIVLDLPETKRDEAALGDRIEFAAGSFFERVPAGDAYVLSGILHDWDDERAARILRTIRAAASSEARLLVTESVIAPGNDRSGAKWLDLLMLTISGRERDEAEWRALLTSAAWSPVRVTDGLIEARPA
jgi:hypothetical protein